uniref:Uncharacterized protein n=1 Tax=Oryza glumipatula TaxID=40148 RepID=A0A0E0AFR7_9ORYZ
MRWGRWMGLKSEREGCRRGVKAEGATLEREEPDPIAPERLLGRSGAGSDRPRATSVEGWKGGKRRGSGHPWVAGGEGRGREEAWWEGRGRGVVERKVKVGKSL